MNRTENKLRADGLKRYRVFQGALNGRHFGSRIKEPVWAKGPKTAMKMLFPKATIREATQKEVFGNIGNQTPSSIRRGSAPGFMPPRNWVQLDCTDTGKSYFYVFMRV